MYNLTYMIRLLYPRANPPAGLRPIAPFALEIARFVRDRALQPYETRSYGLKAITPFALEIARFVRDRALQPYETRSYGLKAFPYTMHVPEIN